MESMQAELADDIAGHDLQSGRQREQLAKQLIIVANAVALLRLFHQAATAHHDDRMIQQREHNANTLNYNRPLSWTVAGRLCFERVQ